MAMKLEQDFDYKGKDLWEWSVWVNASDAELDRIERVQYTLHPTFPKPVRDVFDRATKFRLTTSGWGVFTVYAKAFLKTGETVEMQHELELRYPSGRHTYR